MLRRAPAGKQPEPDLDLAEERGLPPAKRISRGRVPLAEQLGADMNAARIALDDDDLAASTTWDARNMGRDRHARVPGSGEE